MSPDGNGSTADGQHNRKCQQMTAATAAAANDLNSDSRRRESSTQWSEQDIIGNDRIGYDSSRDINSHFYAINERPVDDISLEFFYKPHTISLLTVSIVAVFFTAFQRSGDGADHSLEDNICDGLLCVVFFFLIISMLTFPNGPFTRPHPAVWRLIFGLSVLYLMALLYLLFQNFATVKSIMYWFYPDLKHFRIDSEKQYAINCSDTSVQRIWNTVDVFAWGHFFGWTMKAILARHYGICWTISVTWEITEMAFAHLLPNFAECWWDSIVLDVLICNGLGIWFGMWICRMLEMRTYKWESIKDIQSTSLRIRRMLLQFTPADWEHVHWFDQSRPYVRFLAVTQLVIFWQMTELNTFFLKHIFDVPPDHPLCLIRLALVGLIVAPSVRQYYTYVTDKRCKRVGTQCWVFGAIMLTEALVCIKFGLNIFAQTQIQNIISWLVIQLLLSIFCISMCILWAKYTDTGGYESLDDYRINSKPMVTISSSSVSS
ncbi:phosphatidylserine synthase-like [Oppia nitens]|uniref:phosphatidylserine synthase-like n=1 Tax=Oppia nitens TaxID=1686743 RepID=UPI0023DC80AE|nr:phosphatidylserine synthase-like [Oppia nitens]